MSKGIVLAALLALPFASPAVTFHVVDLGCYWWTNTSTAYAVNNSSLVTGQSNINTGMAFKWTGGSALRPPGLMPTAFRTSTGLSISDAGHVAGYFWYEPQLNAPCVWDPNGRFHRIPFPPLTAFGEAWGVDSAGEVVGWARGLHPSTAWFWSQGVGLIEMGTLMSDGWSEAYAVNERGEAVGSASVPFQDTSVSRAFFWSQKSGMVDLGKLPGYQVSIADSINDSGLACGLCADILLPEVACLFSTKAPPVSLGQVQGWPGAFTVAKDINNLGHVVGSAFDGSKNSAFFYTPQSGMVEINSLLDAESKAAGWSIWNGQSINDHDEIAGLGVRNGGRRAVLLVPND